MDVKILETIKQLRRDTGAGLAACSEALQEANGDFEKAKEIARLSVCKTTLYVIGNIRD